MILFRWSYDYCTGADFGGLLSLYANGNAVEVYYLAWFYFIVHMLSVAWSKSVLGVIYVMAFWFFFFFFWNQLMAFWFEMDDYELWGCIMKQNQKGNGNSLIDKLHKYSSIVRYFWW